MASLRSVSVGTGADAWSSAVVPALEGRHISDLNTFGASTRMARPPARHASEGALTKVRRRTRE